MMRRSLLQALLLGLVLAVTLPPLALLCRGRSPSRFAPSNLPAWERKAPRPAPIRVHLRDTPLPPDTVQFAERPAALLRRADENKLLSGLEMQARTPPASAGDAGTWLERACALGRADKMLAAKQDRVTLRLMNDEDADGYLAAGRGRRRWTAPQIVAAGRNLRGLLAFYALTHKTPVIYAAMQAGDLIASTPALNPPAMSAFALASPPAVPAMPLPSKAPAKALPPRTFPAAPVVSPAQTLVLPMARLYLLTGEVRYRQWAMRQARRGGADSAALCALYAATGQTLFLREAQKAWKRSVMQGHSEPAEAAALLAAAGTQGYADALRTLPAPWPCPLAPGSMAYAVTQQGLAVNVWSNSRVSWMGVDVAQQVTRLPKAPVRVLLTFAAAYPRKFTLVLPVLDAGTRVFLNNAPLPIPARPAALALRRTWKRGDRLLVTAAPGLTAAVNAPPHLPFVRPAKTPP